MSEQHEHIPGQNGKGLRPLWKKVSPPLDLSEMTLLHGQG